MLPLFAHHEQRQQRQAAHHGPERRISRARTGCCTQQAPRAAAEGAAPPADFPAHRLLRPARPQFRCCQQILCRGWHQLHSADFAAAPLEFSALFLQRRPLCSVAQLPKVSPLAAMVGAVAGHATSTVPHPEILATQAEGMVVRTAVVRRPPEFRRKPPGLRAMRPRSSRRGYRWISRTAKSP